MKKRTKLTICLGVICALLVAISSWYTIAFNNSRLLCLWIYLNMFSECKTCL